MRFYLAAVGCAPHLRSTQIGVEKPIGKRRGCHGCRFDAAAGERRGCLSGEDRRSGPHIYTYDPPEGVAKTNIVNEPHTVPIFDMRPIADGLNLDVQGFALVDAPTAVQDFYDEAQLRDVYYREAEELVKQVTGASRVVVFDHTIRRREQGVEDRTPGTPRQPVTRIHGDYTEVSGPQRVRDLMGAEAEDLLHAALRHRQCLAADPGAVVGRARWRCAMPSR